MMANVITGLRILVSAALLLCPVFSPIFYAMYVKDEDVDEFDKEFPPKEKLKLPGQIFE